MSKVIVYHDPHSDEEVNEPVVVYPDLYTDEGMRNRNPEWNRPTTRRVGVFSLRLTYKCAHCGLLVEVPFVGVEVFDDDTRLVCNECGKVTGIRMVAETAT